MKCEFIVLVKSRAECMAVVDVWASKLDQRIWTKYHPAYDALLDNPVILYLYGKDDCITNVEYDYYNTVHSQKDWQEKYPLDEILSYEQWRNCWNDPKDRFLRTLARAKLKQGK